MRNEHGRVNEITSLKVHPALLRSVCFYPVDNGEPLQEGGQEKGMFRVQIWHLKKLSIWSVQNGGKETKKGAGTVTLKLCDDAHMKRH
jgi:hypothetical protein